MNQIKYIAPSIVAEHVPTFRVSKAIKPRTTHANTKRIFNYHAPRHRERPHVVKFSGGRSSGVLLFVLLESGLLKAERGDAIIFNNTSAEHPKTYQFVATCKDIVEQRYKIPFFWVEHCTYEDSRAGEYTRHTSFRLVNSQPYSVANPDGYRWRGEVFEELLSLKGYLPSQFNRTCTLGMKLNASRSFLKEWFANTETTQRLGHYGNGSRIDIDELYNRHLKNGGGVPKDIFIKKKECLINMPFVRFEQRWANFSSAWKPFDSDYLKKKGRVLGDEAQFGGNKGIEYLSFIGLRYDEMRRINKTHLRNNSQAKDANFRGEYVYTPLEDMKMTTEDVNEFWQKQGWDLQLNTTDNLSNCTLCFLKGVKKLSIANKKLASELTDEYKNTPVDINWWIRVEQEYGRDMVAEKREMQKDIPDNFIGFFGARSGFFYKSLLENDPELEEDYPDDGLPCDCTD
ncbi:MAG: hypothetical protein K0U45_03435 [Alphaproteobacteria bacterium]|nr:hypothetical protein [Alphaproteobacteria bacterium]